MPFLLDDAVLTIEAASALYKLQKVTGPLFGVIQQPTKKTFVGLNADGNAIMAFEPADITPLPANTEITVTDAVSEPSGTPYQKYTLNSGAPNFDSLYEFGEIPEIDIPAGVDQTAATNNFNVVINNVSKDVVGKPALKALPDKAKSAIDPDDIDATYNTSDQAQKIALETALEQSDVPMNKQLKGIVNKTSRKQDGSRTSKEYHEWKYCCVLSNNYGLLTDLGTGQSVSYNKTDAVATADGVTPVLSTVPPYHRWIEFPELRQACNLVKKLRRLRGRCGGEALWKDQGFATKEAAIKSDLEASTDWDTLRAALGAYTAFDIV